ncbi:MAG: class I SAM-dependent RNA methyltransferase [Alicyclobacillaceae bacterium]|jgi:putative N6-adenine-specific DNA methylase|nr:class I SAM-dependent RNA methyltransferase [Alicyclobacillaceae bacterium]
MNHVTFIATAAFGLEAVVARELHGMGYTNTTSHNGYVEFQADATALATANLWLRTADRLYLKMGEFAADTFDQLFEGTKQLPWWEWLPVNARFPVSGRSVDSVLHSVPACQSIVKKAIVDSLLAHYQTAELPETGATFAVQVVLIKDVAHLWLDTSGEGLHKRGYRQLTATAPLRETLAAALVLLSRWQGHRPLLDPLCGSGTIAVEAALIGRNRAPGLDRRFASEEWPALSPAAWREAREVARSSERTDALDIVASDIDKSMLSYVGYHARKAGVGKDIRIEQADVRSLRIDRDYGCLITNPPYGERMGHRDELGDLYLAFARMLRKAPTWSLFVITSDTHFEKQFGRRADKRRKLYNGRIATQFYQMLGPMPPRPAEHWLRSGPLQRDKQKE